MPLEILVYLVPPCRKVLVNRGVIDNLSIWSWSINRADHDSAANERTAI